MSLFVRLSALRVAAAQAEPKGEAVELPESRLKVPVFGDFRRRLRSSVFENENMSSFRTLAQRLLRSPNSDRARNLHCCSRLAFTPYLEIDLH
jgi:hypothetical protein